MAVFEYESRIPVPAEELFRWHARPGAFERLTPPWEPVELASQTGGIEDGARVELLVGPPPVRRKWIAEHRNYRPGESFQDVQVSGPFEKWEHTHRVRPDGAGASVLTDHIEYELPFHVAGRVVGAGYVRKKLERMFAYRHRVTADDLAAHWKHREQTGMKILVSGSTGLVGSQLVPFLTTGGHEVTRLVRPHAHGKSQEGVTWDVKAGTVDQEGLAGHDAVVHLAGESIVGRWTQAKKDAIRNSRTEGTRLLAESLAKLEQKPQVLVCASAVGYYGDRGDEELDEGSPPGSGFLAEVCQEWEAAADPAREAGIRVVHVRIGVVLSADGGALEKMLLPFKLGAGGVVGSGNQYWSWVALDDVIGAIHHALTTEDLSGPVNATAPSPATNREFTKALGRVLHRPTVLPMPGFAAKMALGQMADDLLLASARVLPKKLQGSGYEFRFPELEGALRHVLGRG